MQDSERQPSYFLFIAIGRYGAKNEIHINQEYYHSCTLQYINFEGRFYEFIFFGNILDINKTQT